MKEITKTDLFTLLKDHPPSEMVSTQINKHIHYYLTKITQAELLTSIIGYHRHHAIIMKKKWKIFRSTQTLQSCIDVFKEKNLSFEALAKKLIKGNYTPSWFETCLKIKKAFDPQKINHFILCPPNQTEKKECPNSKYRLIDGAHRALVIAHLIQNNKNIQKTFNAIILKNPPSKKTK